MAFPTTNVIDAGTSPIENPISTRGWTGPTISGQQPLQRTSTGIARGSATGGSYLTTTYGPDTEVYAEVAVLTAGTNTEEGVLFVRGKDFGTALVDGYSVKISARATASTDRIRIYREDDSVSTQLGSTYVIGTIAVGDKYGLQIVGSNLEAFYCPASTGIWVSAITATDATYAAAGFIGMNTQRSESRFINFGGGKVGGDNQTAWISA